MNAAEILTQDPVTIQVLRAAGVTVLHVKLLSTADGEYIGTHYIFETEKPIETVIARLIEKSDREFVFNKLDSMSHELYRLCFDLGIAL